MADIELVIKISEEQYNTIKSDLYNTFPAEMREWGLEAIRNGTPLPKGHGRLIDADALKKEYPHDTDWDYPVNTNSGVVESIEDTPTIIGADKESEDAEKYLFCPARDKNEDGFEKEVEDEEDYEK